MHDSAMTQSPKVREIFRKRAEMSRHSSYKGLEQLGIVILHLFGSVLGLLARGLPFDQLQTP